MVKNGPYLSFEMFFHNILNQKLRKIWWKIHLPLLSDNAGSSIKLFVKTFLQSFGHCYHRVSVYAKALYHPFAPWKEHSPKHDESL